MFKIILAISLTFSAAVAFPNSADKKYETVHGALDVTKLEKIVETNMQVYRQFKSASIIDIHWSNNPIVYIVKAATLGSISVYPVDLLIDGQHQVSCEMRINSNRQEVILFKCKSDTMDTRYVFAIAPFQDVGLPID